MTTTFARNLLALTALSLAACGTSGGGDASVDNGFDATVLADGMTVHAHLAPLEDNTATAPECPAGQPCPESLNTVKGMLAHGGFVHAKGYVHAPIAIVYAAAHVPDVCRDRRSVQTATVDDNIEPSLPFSFRLHNVSQNIVRVEFRTEWRFDVTQGSLDHPTQVVARFLKLPGDTGFITTLEGSVVLTRVDDETTAIDLIEHLDAALQGADQAETTMKDYFASVVAQSHDQPLPTYH